jgi:hypothetical protein
LENILEIQQADGTAIGTLILDGLTGGPAPVGTPKAGVTGNFAVIGGTGAFLGARGQTATIMNTHRATSTLENPINRRTFPSGLWKVVVQLIPMTTPEVVLTTAGPAIVHSADNSPVTAAKPARTGEVLTLYALGLGGPGERGSWRTLVRGRISEHSERLSSQLSRSYRYCPWNDCDSTDVGVGGRW